MYDTSQIWYDKQRVVIEDSLLLTFLWDDAVKHGLSKLFSVPVKRYSLNGFARGESHNITAWYFCVLRLLEICWRKIIKYISNSGFNSSFKYLFIISSTPNITVDNMMSSLPPFKKKTMRYIKLRMSFESQSKFALFHPVLLFSSAVSVAGKANGTSFFSSCHTNPVITFQNRIRHQC